MIYLAFFMALIGFLSALAIPPQTDCRCGRIRREDDDETVEHKG